MLKNIKYFIKLYKMTNNYDDLYNLANQNYIYFELNEEEFIINQLKFMYGSYYDKAISGEPIYIDNISTINCHRLSSNDILNNNIQKKRPEFEDLLFDSFTPFLI